VLSGLIAALVLGLYLYFSFWLRALAVQPTLARPSRQLQKTTTCTPVAILDAAANATGHLTPDKLV
jgi:hypothetical protein